MRQRRRAKDAIGAFLVVVALCLFALWTLAPFAWAILSSLMEQRALTATPIDFSPQAFTLANYAAVFESAAPLARGLVNSLIVAFGTTLLALALGAPAAYALARLELPGASMILMLILATQMIPGIVISFT
jgi:multiple sugar transport system permease protein